MPTDMLLSVIAVILGFAIVIKGADWFVQGAGATARNLGVSPLVIGLTIVGLGTSAPEMLISAIATLDGNGGLAVGNALGSNIANIALVLGITALVVPLVVRSETLRREYPVMFLIMLVSLVLVADGELGRLDGLILIVGMVLMLWWMVLLGKRKDHDPLEAEYASEIPTMTTPRALLWLVIGLVLLLASSRALVWGAVNIAHFFGVSDLIIGLTVVAIGTSLPELAASLMGALRQEPDIAIGNVIGSNMFNLLVVLGIPGLLGPLQLDAEVLSRDYPYMIGLSIALFVMAYGLQGDGRINRLEGGLLLLAYIAYLALLYFNVQQI
ncbi:cation:H+ antiporter [Thiohalophilus thiocyanatoxydans]|uniref:Cation:H+ antiporter n=2 Tax=Thiohalophilus thiocyanatoxydans TaxID=381308 RepID=A0A4R8IUU9_9GAMM|nr:cation:H+ antiporter [Thiohalophilus thiocyanatoxydans]